MSGQGLVTSPTGTISSLSERVMSTMMTRPSDALELLFDAAHPEDHRHDIHPDPNVPANDGDVHMSQSEGTCLLRAPPVLSTHAPPMMYGTVARLSDAEEEVLDQWDRCRFVRQGWFTAQEAVTYLDLFFEYLAPFSPVLTDEFKQHSNHHRLVTLEPILCCTILMIASRFFTLPGAGGVSRSHFVHQRLWSYCENLIRRVMFGQEKHSSLRTRAVGTIESFILIADWHPRALHFPPETEGWDGELTNLDYDRRNRLRKSGEAPLIRWREDVFEPSKRSDRMSWMLLGAATNLAYELGIFSDDATAVTATLNSQSIRHKRARKLLYVYVSQLAARLGYSSILPQNISFHNSATSVNSPASDDEKWDNFMEAWMELTRLTKTASAMFFQSTTFTKQQLLNGHYTILLQHFAPSLTKWHDKYLVPSSGELQDMNDLLSIEYYYLNVYTHALAIQAVVERALSRGLSNFEPNREDVLTSCALPQDYDFVKIVISGSSRILQIANRMSVNGRLRHTPVRTLLCITSSSVFFLKALSLGGRNAEMKASLRTLDEGIAALKASPIDDMDFSSGYATLLEKHVARFRKNFTIPHANDHNANNASVELDHGLTNSFLDNDQQAALAVIPAVINEPDFEAFNNTGIGTDGDWWTRPFDPNIAPFSTSGDYMTLGFELDSLDFLWSIPDESEGPLS